jgi:phage tail-like protein
MPKDSEDPMLKYDPYLGLRFWVQIEGVQIAGFAECSGLIIETETFEYAEGGNNTFTYKLPVRTKYSNITLKRGIDPGQDLYTWFLQSIDGIPNKRKNISIMVYGQTGSDPVKKWDLVNAFPVKWSGPDLKSDAGATAIETLEFAHEGLNVTSGGR